MFVNALSPYEEAQHIIEVLERGNAVKGISREASIIQIEQTDEKDVQIVLDELEARRYEIISIKRYGTFVAAGIRLKKHQKEQSKTKEGQGVGFEPGD